MITFINQKIITVCLEQHNKESSPYGCIQVNASNFAAKRLSGNAYKLYVRFTLNQDKHRFALSRKNIMEELGLSRNGYDRAIQELKQKHYLIQEKDRKNNYLFYELPVENDEIFIIPQNGDTVINEGENLPVKNEERIPPKMGENTQKMGEDTPKNGTTYPQNEETNSTNNILDNTLNNILNNIATETNGEDEVSELDKNNQKQKEYEARMYRKMCEDYNRAIEEQRQRKEEYFHYEDNAYRCSYVNEEPF